MFRGTEYFYFFFNDTATTEIYTLSLHDALPISSAARAWSTGRNKPARHATGRGSCPSFPDARAARVAGPPSSRGPRSEEHTSELQSRQYLVCRLLLEKKKKLPPLTLYLPLCRPY